METVRVAKLEILGSCNEKYFVFYKFQAIQNDIFSRKKIY